MISVTQRITCCSWCRSGAFFIHSRFNQSKSEISRDHFSLFFSIDRYQSLPAWRSTRKSMSRRGTYAYKFCVHDFVTSLTNTLTEIGNSHVVDRIFFESITNLGVECYFKRMQADHDMPTVANYPYRRARCVEDDMLRISHI